MNIYPIFFRLLRNELWQQGKVPDSLGPDQFRLLERFARDQSVWGLVCGSIVRNNIPTGNDDNAMDAVGATLTHQRSAKKMTAVIQRLATLFEQENICYALFKGQALTGCYPRPYLRTLGDIDLYLPGGHFRRAVSAIEGLGIAVNHDELDKHYDCEMDGIRVELHYRVETFGSRRHQCYFDRLVDDDLLRAEPHLVDIGGVGVRTFSPTVHTLAVFKHLFNHFLVEGVGLRQFCDLALMLHRYRADLDADRLERHLKKMGYRRAFLATGALLVGKLGLPKEEFPLALRPCDEQWARKMLQEVAERGNFGAADRHKGETARQKSLNTARVAMSHCLHFWPLAKWDITCLMPRRTAVTIKKHLQGRPS